jgi:hypothetical protein
MAQTKIMFCGCKHEHQDEHYGKQQRVHNESIDNKQQAWTCTVCGTKKKS